MIEMIERFRETAKPSPLLTLTKPAITLMAVLITGGGMLLSHKDINLTILFLTLIGTALAVSSAMVLNQYIELEIDSVMRRTKNRPLPVGEISPAFALKFGILLGVASLLLLFIGVNFLTGLLGFFALGCYTLIYTPLKKHTPLALIIGAVPGAMPALMGWTAATNRIDMPGLVLFSILFCWQIPHFIAIAIIYKEDYLKAGIKTVPFTNWKFSAQLETLGFTLLLIPISLSLFALGIGGWAYLCLVSLGGVILLWFAIIGFKNSGGVIWARNFFFATLFYLPILSFGLILDWVYRI